VPARSFSPSGGCKIGGGSAVSEIDEHATNPKQIQSIIVLRIVGPITIPHWNAGRLAVLGQLAAWRALAQIGRHHDSPLT
jgi:hypothetical protein